MWSICPHFSGFLYSHLDNDAIAPEPMSVILKDMDKKSIPHHNIEKQSVNRVHNSLDTPYM